jgi:hypothetical protein
MSTYVFNAPEKSSDIHNATNRRIYDRNIPSKMLQPYVDVRPVMTKYSLMPIVDPRKPPTVPMQQQPVYQPRDVFNPGNRQAPWSGFASSVNVESELRNQIYALQKCSQATYVPSSSSDLYEYNFQPQKNIDTNKYQPYPRLFKQEKFQSFNPNPENIGNGLFQNCTRQQLKDVPSQPSCK